MVRKRCLRRFGAALLMTKLTDVSFADDLFRLRKVVIALLSMSTRSREQWLVLKIDWFILSYCCLMVRKMSIFAQLTHHDPVLYKLYVLSTFTPDVRSSCHLLPDLDRANVNNAYVSGMKQDLNMRGNEFNVARLLAPL